MASIMMVLMHDFEIRRYAYKTWVLLLHANQKYTFTNALLNSVH